MHTAAVYNVDVVNNLRSALVVVKRVSLALSNAAGARILNFDPANRIIFIVWDFALKNI